ncbi:toxin biosynthesis [Colletotrichum plurivorum]|uniref:Toxin biosynthesis n=1 Tax=Colletotrichum plurivorum TaxID=2175906 RepID=A0A8H6NDI5_9PEZI|nr:toxin biosynthesis [Colletotrichum plurivorum]
MAGTVVFITGVTQGIGKGLVQAYLQRPQHTVVGSVRNSGSPAVAELKALAAAKGSRLVLVHIESTSPEDPKNAVQDLEAKGIDHVDIVIANAGGSPPVVPLDQVSGEDMLTAFRTNVLGPLALWQALHPLLKRSAKPKWVSMSTVGSSMTLMPEMGTHMTPAYGTSKAALNWLTTAIFAGNEWLTTLLLHPGLVQTEPGNWVARQIGMEKAPVTIHDCVTQVVATIEGATRAQSGKLINAMEGIDMPW